MKRLHSAPGSWLRSAAVFSSLLSLASATSIAALNVVKLLPDPKRPRIYAINQNGGEEGSILVIDAISRESIRSIPVGKTPADMDFTENSAELLVLNTTEPSISRIDLETLTVTQTHALATFDASNKDKGGRIADGPGNVIYYLDQAWGPRLRVFDTSTGTVLQTLGATPSSSSYGFGDMVLRSDRSALFGWVLYGGWAGSYVVSYDVATDGTLTFSSQGNSNYPTVLKPAPYDSPAIMTTDDSRLIIKDRAVDQLDPGVFPEIYPDEILATSPRGEIVCGANAIYPGNGGEILYEFPAPVQVPAITQDYSHLVYFDSSTQSLAWLDLVATLGTDALGLKIAPTDGSVVFSPSMLEWFPTTGISEYEVYFGTESSAVAAATTASSEFLGTSTQASISLPGTLVPGSTYYWRAVPAGRSGGTLRSFTVSELNLSRSSLQVRTMTGVSKRRETIELSAPDPASWSASSDASWLKLKDSSGTTPSALLLDIDTRTLAAGNYSATVTLNTGGDTLLIPVSLRVDSANFIIAQGDLEQPFVWLVSQESESSSSPSYLVRFDTRNNLPTAAVDCGRGVTDLTIHYKENRIYLTNHLTGILRAFDRSSLDQVQTYQFAPKGTVGYASGDAYRVFAGRKGRIVVTDFDQWVDASLIDTADGSVIDSAGVRTGDGVADPSGRYYYHIDISNLKRFDTDPDHMDTFLSGNVGSGALIAMSGDGMTLARGSALFDQDLVSGLTLPITSGYPDYDAVQTLSFHGELAVSKSKVFNARNGEQLAILPVSSAMVAIAGDPPNIYQFQPGVLAPSITDLSGIVDLDPRGMVPGIADGGTVIGAEQPLSWSLDAAAISYQVYFGSSRDAVAAATTDSPQFLGDTGITSWSPGISGLELDTAYFWRVDVVGFDSTKTGTVWSFDTAPIDITPREVALVFPAGTPLPDQTVSLHAPAATSWTATTASSWIKLDASSGSTDSTFTFGLDSTGLAAGLHEGSITFTSGADQWELPVSLELLPLHYTLAKADLELDRIYAVSQESENGPGPAHLIVIDTNTDTILHALPVGSSVTDLAIHYQENRIYVPNWKSGVLRALDRGTFEEVQTYQFEPSTGYGSSSGDIYRVSAGTAGRIVIEQEDQWIDIQLVDTTDGSRLAHTGEREGGGSFDPAGRYYYHGDSNISNAVITRHDTTSDKFTPLNSVRLAANYYGSRRVFLSGDGSRVYWNGGVMDPDLNVIHMIDKEAVSATLHGDLFFTSDTIYNGTSGLQMGGLAVNTSIQAVSSAQDKLFLFDGDSFTVVDLTAIAELPPRGITPTITDGTTVIGTDQTLGWSVEPFAISYELYFGTDRDAVAGAKPGSSVHLGNLTQTSWSGALPFELGGDYFWRVDVNGFNGRKAGAVWSFSVAPIDISPRELVISFPANSPIPSQTLALSAPAVTPWTAESATSWISLGSSFGNTDAPLVFALDSTGLAPGIHKGAITFTSGTDTWDLPVTLDLIAFDITVMKPDPARPGTIYAINHADPDTHFSHLLSIDAASGRVTDAIEVGRNATDFAIDPTTGLLYVANHNFPVTQVVNLETFTVLPPMQLGPNVERIALDGQGRLFASRINDFGTLVIWDLKTLQGSNPGVSLSYGSAEIEPTGRFLYHGSTYSRSMLRKIDLSADPEIVVASSPVLTTGRLPLLLSADGSRVILDRNVLDAECRLISLLPGTAHSISAGAELAAGADAVWWVDGGAKVFDLPVVASTSAFSADSSHLVLFDPAGPSLHSITVSSFTGLPGPSPRPGQVLTESPTTISWVPVPLAGSYRLVISGDPSGTVIHENIAGTSFELPDPLAFGVTYSWYVETVTPSGEYRAPDLSFTVGFPDGPAIDGLSGYSFGKSVAIGPDYFLIGGDGRAAYHQFNPLTGTNSPFQTFTIDGSSYDHNFGSPVAADSAAAFVGAPSFDDPLSGTGAVFAYRPDSRGFMRASGRIQAPSPVQFEGFGGSIAAGGGLVLAGSQGSGAAGRVLASLTQPERVDTQVIKPSNSVVGDGFGRRIAIRGNTALISAPGGGSSYSRKPNAYVFDRNSAGQWLQSQELPIPNATTYGSAGTSVALGDGVLAINNSSAGEVSVYTLGSSWSLAQVINRASVEGATTSFGSSVALHGDVLFVGDTAAQIHKTNGGAVFTFRRSQASWKQGPTISPGNLTRSAFGTSLSVRDGWLLVGGSGSAWLFPIDPTPNHSPQFTSPLPAQAVSGRQFEIPVTAEDPDGNEGLSISATQIPAWLSLEDHGDGSATLSGTPTASSGSTYDMQLKVTDPDGASTLRTFRLTLLSESDIPVITVHPAAADRSVGQELILRGAVEGIGPFQWQWQLDGADIPGANQATLNLSELGLDDAGSYSFTVSNVVKTTMSNSARVDVRPADRFAGPWSSFGGGPRRTGTNPATLGRHIFTKAWEVDVQSRYDNTQRPAIAEGRVFVTPYVYFGGVQNALALDLATGETLWTHSFNDAYSINPPSYHNGRVYVQRGNHSGDTQLWCLDATSGATIWSSPHSAQWERYEAPAVTDEGIWVNGGSYGGMYGFAPDGTQMFFRSMNQVSGWAPAVSGGRLFTSLLNTFIEHNPVDGTPLWTVTTKASGTSIPVISGNRGVVSKSGGLACIDLDESRLLWEITGTQANVPAVSGGVVYTLSNNLVPTFSLETGEPGRVFTTPEARNLTSNQPVILNDHLIVANDLRTFVFSLITGELVQSLDGGGKLAYSDGYLVVAGNDKKMRAFFANAAPEFAVTLPTRTLAPANAANFGIDLAAHIRDADSTDSLTWEITSISRPEIFNSIDLDLLTGQLSVVYNPWQSGSSVVVVTATDSAGNTAETPLTFEVPALPLPKLTVRQTMVLNRQTGLYEQTVIVKNIAAREIAGFDLTVTGLPVGVRLQNASGRVGAKWLVRHRQPVAAGASVTFVLEYYTPVRGTVLNPKVSVALVTEPELAAAVAVGAGVDVDRCLMLKEGLLIEFSSKPNRLYEIQYLDDFAQGWKVSPVLIRAAANRVQWIDRGPPRTDSHPSEKASRFYRVREVTAE